MKSILTYLTEVDYQSIHGHDKSKTNSIEWYFHNYEREPGQKNGYKHCIGHKNNPYTLEHNGNLHLIDREYAMGHGINRKSQWFKFNKKVNSTHWDLNSFVKVKTSNVPKEYLGKSS